MRLEAVGKRYGLRQPWVIRAVSLDVAAGRLIRFEGRNGSAVCNPPVIRGVAIAVLTTTGAVIAALVTSISPANAAIKDTEAAPHAAAWPVGPLLVAVIALIAISWAISTLIAARRGT